jgi:hypothetical protein
VDEISPAKPKRTRQPRKVSESNESLELIRKAPTPLAAEKSERRFTRKHTIVIVFFILLGVGSSALLGLTDPGHIDVTSLIDERNKIAAERGEQLVSTTEEQLPDGGLIPADPSTMPPATTTPSTATSTASTTPEGNVPLTDEEAAAAMEEAATATSTDS